MPSISPVQKRFHLGTRVEGCHRFSRSSVVPRKKPGRRRRPEITAAHLDAKAGMNAYDLCLKHIPGWLKHNRDRRIVEQRRLMDALRSRAKRERG